MKNSLILRFKVFLCIVLALAAHAFATNLAENDPEGMAIYHGSGALMDVLLALAVTSMLAGLRGRIMGYLMLTSVIVNIAGWLLYMAYVAPVYYNAAMWALTAAQVLCLFLSGQACRQWAAKLPSMKRFFAWGVRAARAS